MEPRPARVLVIDDTEEVHAPLALFIKDSGKAVVCFTRASEGFEYLRSNPVNVALVDIFLENGECGFNVIERMRREYPHIPVIAISGMKSQAVAVRAMKCSAVDFLEKPILPDLLHKAIDEAMNRRELAGSGDSAGAHPGIESLVGESAAMCRLRDQISRIAAVDSPALIVGESGTGKSMVAHMIHLAGPRAHSPFLQVSVAAFPPALIAAELFGWERGAFTGASEARTGRLEAAGDGTLFLDEVSDIPLSAQGVLLRALEEHTFERLGESKPRRFRARVICATNQRLEELVRLKRFRSDLYHRIRCLDLGVPPLREHPEDIPELVRYFLNRPVLRSIRKIREVEPKAMDLLNRHFWPGNVRELMGTLHHAVTLHTGDTLQCKHLPQGLTETIEALGGPPEAGWGQASPKTLGKIASPSRIGQTSEGKSGRPPKGLTPEQIRDALAAEHGVASRAAHRLGIARSTFYTYLRNLEGDQVVPPAL